MGISKKVTLVVSLLAGLLLAGVGFTGLQYRDREMTTRMRQDGRVLGPLVKVTAEAVLDNPGKLGAIEDLVSRGMPARVTIFGWDGRVVAPVPTEEKPSISRRALDIMERNVTSEEFTPQAYIYRAALHFGETRRVAGALELRLYLDSYQDQHWLPIGMLVAGALLVLFAGVVGFYSREAIQRPIGQLMEGMDHIIKGDLTQVLPLDRTDEIGRIAYRFNEMTARLRDAQGEIRRSADTKLGLEQRLRQSEKLATIGQLSAEIAHEVGTPLNVIGGRARSLRRKADQPQEVTKNATIIADQAARITKIIQQMLDLSRARVPQRTAVDLGRVLEDTLSLLEDQIQRSSIEVVRQLPEDLPPVQADADGMQQVFINLIHNAAAAMEAGGTLTITAQVERRRKGGLDLAPPETYVAVAISDTGEGIPEEQRGQIFEPFYSTKQRGEGTGLGLTVVLGLVKEHDGWIDVEPVQPHGTTFCIYLPTGDEAEEPDPTPAEPQDEP